MQNRSRRRFQTLSLVVGLVLLVASPIGWAWLQYDLYREEEDVLAELTHQGIGHYAQRGSFLAQEVGQSSEGIWEILTEDLRSGIDERFPWLRPLRRVNVNDSISVARSQRIATLPRLKRLYLVRVPEESSPAPSMEAVGIDVAALQNARLAEAGLDVPIPQGRALVEDELRKFEIELAEAWRSLASEPDADRFAVAFLLNPGGMVSRLSVDGDRRTLSTIYPQQLDICLQVGSEWRSVQRNSDEALALWQREDEPYFASYASYPPFVRVEFPAYGQPMMTTADLLDAGVEYAEALDDGRYVVRFGAFEAPECRADSPGAFGPPVVVTSATFLVRSDDAWSVERGESHFGGTRRLEWMNDLERHGGEIVVREQVYRILDGRATSSSQYAHAVFDWNLNPDFADDEFSLASAGAGPLGPPRPIPWTARWYFATAALGLLLTTYATLRIVARRLLARRERRAAARGQAEPTPA